MKKIEKYLKVIILAFKVIKPLAIAFALSNLLLFYFKFDIGKINDNDFLFNFFGILLGFAITIFTFIISMVEKIREKAEIKYAGDKNKSQKLQRKIRSLYVEIKEDIVFTFISLILIGLLYITDFNIPKIHFYKTYYFDQRIAVQSLKLALFALNIFAIYDLIIVSFRLSDTAGILKISENDNEDKGNVVNL